MASIDFVRCLLSNGSRFHDITHGMCADWFGSLHPAGSPAPVSGVWVDVPDHTLPDGVVRCTFNAFGYVEWRDHVDSESEDANDEGRESEDDAMDDIEEEVIDA